MSVNIRGKMGKLSPVQRKKVEDRAAELIEEEMSLRDLRKARKLTQTLGITQDSVSRLEKRSDLLLSTLQKTVKAMGVLLLNFPIVRRSCCLSFTKTIPRASRRGDIHMHTLELQKNYTVDEHRVFDHACDLVNKRKGDFATTSRASARA